MLQQLADFLQIFLALPLIVVITFILGVLFFSALITMQEHFGSNWYHRLLQLKEGEEEVKKSKTKIEKDQSTLKQEWDRLGRKEHELKKKTSKLQNWEIFLKQSEAELIRNWDNQVLPIEEEVQSVIYPRVLAELKTNSGNDFLKFLKANRFLVEENGQKMARSPEMVEKFTHYLDESFQKREEHDYVLAYFSNRMEKHYNPLLTAWEIYHLYAEKYD